MHYRRTANTDSPSDSPPRKTAADALIEGLAAENRRVLSGWRAVLLLRRATAALPSASRRWSSAPDNVSDLRPLFRQMEARGEISRIDAGPGLLLFEITVPYSGSDPIGEDEILMEAHPYSALSHLSALAFHGLTDILPKEITMLFSSAGYVGQLPVGTTVADWDGIALAPGIRPSSVLGRPVRWVGCEPPRFFGVGEYHPRRYPVRVTTPERTLLDSLLRPELSGGFENVLSAWVSARDVLSLNGLIGDVERFDIGVLRQRAGFVLETMGFHHPALDSWQARARRGGSSRLLGSSPYVPTHSERWSLSINAPIDPLTDSIQTGRVVP